MLKESNFEITTSTNYEQKKSKKLFLSRKSSLLTDEEQEINKSS